MAKEEENHRRFEIDPDVYDTFDGDHVASCLALFREGSIDKRMMISTNDGFHAYAIESYANDKIDDMCYVLDSRLGSAENNLEDIGKLISKYETGENLIEDIQIASDRALDAIHDAGRAYDLLSESINAVSAIREKYKDAFNELITEHHPEIPKAIEKAELMKELE